MILFLKSEAQTDSIYDVHRVTFQKNLEQLGHQYFFSDTKFYPGKFKMNSTQSFSEGFAQLGLKLFPEPEDRANDFYNFLTQLPVTEKQNFIRLYSFYEKVFENSLKKAGLPIELKYLAPALSAMNPLFITLDRKAGIWALTHFQSVLNGGNANRMVDDRFNVMLSTNIAVKQLQKDFKNYKVPQLSVAAFLYGNTFVKNIGFSNGEIESDSILNLLPDDFRKTVAAYQAVAVFLNENRFEPDIDFLEKKENYDTIQIFRQLHFKQIENVIGIPEAQLCNLNPQFRFSIVPENVNGTKIVLPHKYWDDFVLWQDSIYMDGDSALFELIVQKIEYPPVPNRQYLNEPVKDLVIEGKTKIQYRIKTGDVLGIIAEKYDVSITDLKYWNNIYDERRIQAGKKLDIFVPDDDAEYYSNLEKEETSETTDAAKQFQKNNSLKVLEQFDTAKKIEHIVRSGESPYIIAQKYEGVTPELILEWNNIDDPRKIQIGQRLIVYLKK